MSAEVVPADNDDELIDRFIRGELRALGRKPGTVEHYRRDLTRLRRELGRPLSTATDADLIRLFQMSGWAHGLTPYIRKLTWGRLATFYEWLEDEEEIGRAPTGKLRRKLKRMTPPARQLPVYTTVPQFEAMVAATRGTLHGVRDEAIMRVMFQAGGRLTETLSLHLDGVDLAERMIHYRRQTKGGKHRSVPMIPDLRGALEAWLRVRDDQTEALFTAGMRGGFAHPRSWQELLHRRACEARDPEDPSRPLQRWICAAHDNACSHPTCRLGSYLIHPHAFRHGYAVEMLRSKACTVEELRDLMGHASIATTNIYVHIVGSQASAERIRRRFGKRERGRQ